MSAGKSKARLISCLVSWWMILLMFACSSPASITPTAVSYASPVLPGPISRVDTTIKVEPKLIDDYFPNPGMGWQDGIGTPDSLNMPESVMYPNRRQIGWLILNPAQGVYDWSALDKALQEATRDGKQLSFRVYTMVGERYGGHMIPDWVFAKGATLLPSSDEPDYSSCVYQDEWGKFVEELRKVYDGNPNIAFIDISGYGNFNEWSWQDAQTEWDVAWEEGYVNGAASSDLFETLDGQARRRLADMFIGGSYDEHRCRLATGETDFVAYSYEGFQETQLVMPYAGIVQSSQYVFQRRSDVGFRYDCLGKSGERVLEKVGSIISQVWRTAPVVLELCKPNEFDLDDAKMLLRMAHGSLVHDNDWRLGPEKLEELMRDAGYRYFLKEATLHAKDRTIEVQMNWQNLGYAPSYPKMGQEFQLYFYLMDAAGTMIHRQLVPVNIFQWLPARLPDTPPQVYPVSHTVQLPFVLSKGIYYAGVSIVDMRTGKPIDLAIDGKDPAGWYLLSPLEIE